MLISQLSLKNFRNIENLKIAFDKPITILYGNNGQGKTNIVESIYLLSNATSFRTSYSKEMIDNKSEFAIIEGEIVSLKRKNKHKVILSKSGKTAYINDVVINKVSEYIGKFNAVCFSPEDVSLFKDSPGIRRQFLDKELSSLFPVYIKQLINFKNTLEQRNALLKGTIDYDLLDVIDEKLVESSYDIYKRRKWLIEKLIEFATKIYKTITNDSQEIRIVYNTFLDEMNKDAYFTKAKQIYKNSITKDVEKKYTIQGIHKDDFKVYLNDLEIDMFASQGQQRLISLSMKLAVAEIIAKANKVEPIIILDDAFSELDKQKKIKLFDYVSKKMQVFITCTDFKNIIDKSHKNMTLLHIKEGNVIERGSL